MPEAKAPVGRRNALLTIFIVLVFTVLSAQLLGHTNSPDFRAVWTAAEFFAADRTGDIYAGSGAIYDMVPPAAWLPHLTAEGAEGQVFPFVYPPLWAALFAPLTAIFSFEQVRLVASILNPLMVAGTALLAWRISARTLPPQAWLLIALPALSLTVVGAIALYQNQPQILVAFLMTLAVERSLSGAPAAAGISLALAASIKIFPAAMLLFWLVQRRRHEAAAFLAAGAALALASVLLAGWPLHQAFLNELRAVSNSILMTRLNFGLPSILTYEILGEDNLTEAYITHLVPPAEPWVWHILELGAAGRVLNTLLQFGVLAGLAWLLPARDDSRATALHWAGATGLLAMVSPLCWAYYFILPLAFCPVLIERYGALRGTALILLVTFPSNIITIVLKAGPGLATQPATLASLAMLLLTVLLLLASRRRAVAQARPQNGRTTLPE